MRWLVLLALGAACGPAAGPEGGEPARLHATVVRPASRPPAPDTVRFAVPALARRCGDGRSVLIEGASERGNGVLVLLRYGDSLAGGTYPVVTLGDSITPRGASVAVRYMMRDVAHGVALDTGAVDLEAMDSLGARVGGSGLDGAVRVVLTAEFVGVPFAADTVSCRFQL